MRKEKNDYSELKRNQNVNTRKEQVAYPQKKIKDLF